ncbi:hypothetical protein [Pseudoduganella violaceinigra]|uniref:hypothetical protein n=1 Tax=Pseudoduganella violaceinigra TaxID=246602 RepID=UPI0004833DEE|nr:hypothetical protein [Pseudoduganella violaceinigra]
MNQHSNVRQPPGRGLIALFLALPIALAAIIVAALTVVEPGARGWGWGIMAALAAVLLTGVFAYCWGVALLVLIFQRGSGKKP